MADLITVQESGYTRQAYKNANDQELSFRKGIRVLPAIHFTEDRIFTFVKKHEIGSPGWSDGGYECREVNRYDQWLPKFRAFALDALIVHPESQNVTLD